ncbi:MAG: hypothetical protein AB2L26_07795 [Ignavibacteria bacterium]
MLYAFRDEIDNPDAPFLDGERVNTHNIGLTFRFIPIRNYTFTLSYVYNLDDNITKGVKKDFSYAFARMNIIY